MFNKSLQLLFALIFTFAFSSSVSAQENKLPQNYMMEKHGVSEPFYCDLEDPIEEIACMAWDAALGASKDPDLDPDIFSFNFAIAASGLVQQIASSARYTLYIDRMGGSAPKGIDGSQICVITKIGSCGNHQLILERLFNFAGINSRRVGIYYSKEGKRFSHAATEFYAGGGGILLTRHGEHFG